MKLIRKINLKFLLKGAFLAALVFVFFTLAQKAERYERNRELIDSIEEISGHKYAESYKCLEFSKDLYAKLASYGIKSQIEIVDTGSQKNEYHAVISVQIDPQSAQVVNYAKIDSCQMVDGELSCQNGRVTDRDTYVASKKK